jgi:hypothetical protein
MVSTRVGTCLFFFFFRVFLHVSPMDWDSLVFAIPIQEIATLKALRSKAYFCNLLIAGIAGLNPAEDRDVLLLSFLCVILVKASATYWSLYQRSLTWCVCVCVCVRARVCNFVWCRNTTSDASQARFELLRLKKNAKKETREHPVSSW